MFGNNPGYLIGGMITGFICHPTVMPIIRRNRAFSNARQNLIGGFTMV